METATVTQKVSLYERLGGEHVVRKIVNDTLDKNLKNPLIGHHFQNIDMDNLKRLVFEFFSMGTGGPGQYTGRDMPSSHKHLKLTEQDYQSSNSDLLEALRENGIPEPEQKEVIALLDTMKADVIS